MEERVDRILRWMVEERGGPRRPEEPDGGRSVLELDADGAVDGRELPKRYEALREGDGSEPRVEVRPGRPMTEGEDPISPAGQVPGPQRP